MGHLCVGENNLHADACGHGELKHVDDDSGNVTEKKDDDNADEDSGKIHLVMSRAVVVGPHMGVSVQTYHMSHNNS